METTSIQKNIIKLRAKHKLTEISTNAWRVVKKNQKKIYSYIKTYENYIMWEKSLYSKINLKRHVKSEKEVICIKDIKNEKLTCQVYMLQIL